MTVEELVAALEKATEDGLCGTYDCGFREDGTHRGWHEDYDWEEIHRAHDALLLKFIGDERVNDAFHGVWYA